MGRLYSQTFSEQIDRCPSLPDWDVLLRVLYEYYLFWTHSLTFCQATRLADESVNSTLLAPRNAVLQTLPRKPWEDQSDEGPLTKQGSKDSLWSKEAEDKARKNVEDFVAGHVVTKYPIQEGKDLTTLSGSTISYEVKGGEKYINPGNIKVLGEREAANGAIWVLDGVIE